MQKADLEGAKFRYELGPVDAEGKVQSYKDIKINMSMNGQGQQSGMSNIKQMDSISSRQDLPGMLSNPTPSSFYQGSGDSTGNPESVLTNPVGNATPDERAYALALLAGNPAIGASANSHWQQHLQPQPFSH